MSQTEVITIQLAPELKAKLNALSLNTKHSISWLAAKAIALYVEEQSEQINQIKQALEIANSSQAQWLDGEDVQTGLNYWGTDNDNFLPTTRNDNINFP